jgi:hypothetical protein
MNKCYIIYLASNQLQFNKEATIESVSLVESSEIYSRMYLLNIGKHRVWEALVAFREKTDLGVF